LGPVPSATGERIHDR
jgi:hypothetical protein